MSIKDNRHRGFKVPEYYFERLDDRILSRVSENRRGGFRVPDGYFEGFEAKYETGGRRYKVLSLNLKPKTRIALVAAAASVLLILAVNLNQKEQTHAKWSALSQSEMSFWIENELVEVSAYDIAEVYSDVELEVPVATSSELTEYLSEIEIEQILLEN